MATISQINANRRNALKSTGPKSPAGKARSSQNAIRHGFASKQIVLNTENEADFQALHAEFVDEYQPSCPTECMLVDEVAVAAWRLRRMQSLETVLLDVRFVLEPGFWDAHSRDQFDQQDPSWTRYRQAQAWKTSDVFERLSRYEARTRSAFYRALAELRRHKDSRPNEPCRDQPCHNTPCHNEPSRDEPCRAEPCRDRKGAVSKGAVSKGAASHGAASHGAVSNGAVSKEAVSKEAVSGTKPVGRTQTHPAKASTSRPIGFVLPALDACLSNAGPAAADLSQKRLPSLGVAP